VLDKSKSFGYRNVYKVEKLGKKTFVVGDMLRFLIMEMALFLELCYLTQKDMVATIIILLRPMVELGQGV